MNTKVIPLGKMIDGLSAIREEKRVLNEKLAEVEGRYKQLESELIERLGAEGADKATGKTATDSISQVVVANVTDWDAFHAFVKKTGFFHLLQRRVSDPAFREVLEMKGDKALAKAGVEPFTKVNLNLRNIKAA